MILHTIFYLARENDGNVYRFPELPIEAKDIYGPQRWLNTEREYDSMMEEFYGDFIHGDTILEIHARYSNTGVFP